MIAISDTLVSFSLGLGYPLSYGSYGLCYFQGFVSLLFERTSWMFTLFLMINCYGIIVHKRYILHIKCIHLIVWPFNIFWQFILYATNTEYGNPNTAPTKCNLVVSNSNNPKAPMRVIWIHAQLYLLYISFLIIIVLNILIWVYYHTKDGRESITAADTRGHDTFNTVLLYPISMGISWLPIVCYRFYSTLRPSTELNINITFLFAPLYGLFLTIIFYAKTSAARQE
jgi:hypothetical protein